jgi:prolipoprotein diacylglyceryl transferase
LESAFIWIVLGTFVGARVGHCLFYGVDGDFWYFYKNPLEIITGIRDGGMASHGATLGIFLGIWIFCKHNRLPFIWGLDRIAIVAPLSGAIIRLGNLFNSEIVGMPTDMPWGFLFPRCMEDRYLELADVPARHPAQLYEALCYVLVSLFILWLYYRKDLGRRRPGLLFGVAMIGIFLSRFFIEFCKERQVAFEDFLPLDMGQMLSIPFIILGIYMIIRAYKRPEVTDVNAVVAHANREYAKELKRKGTKK